MASPSSDETSPVIKSRTGKFLQNVFDKKATAPADQPTPTGELHDLMGELMQVVPEQSQWDEGEESNWDDDFIDETPGQVQPVAATDPAPLPATETINFAPPPPPSQIPPKTITADHAAVVLSTTPPEIKTSANPEITLNPAVVEVSIPRPKNIKYKSKDFYQEAEAITPKSEPVEINIKRPTTIKYKAKPPEKTSEGLPARLLSKVKSIQLPALPTFQIPQLALPKTPDLKLPLGDNLKRLVTIVAAVFLAMVTAWAAINFWPRTITTPIAVVQPAVPTINPEVELIKAVQTRLETLTNLYPVGLITNLELDAKQSMATITVGDLWRSLSHIQQQQTAQSLWQQAVTYQMAKLEVRSSTDQLLARSPVVGGEAIIVSY
jgi:hypothetical protein